MEIVYRARDITEAEIVCGMLEANGIAARVSGYYLQGGVGELAPMNFANVQVDADDLPRARELVVAYEYAAPRPAGAGGPARRVTATARVVVVIGLALLVLAVYLVAVAP